MCLTQPDHALQLSSRRSDPTFRAPRVLAHFTQFDVARCEGVTGLGADYGRDVVTRVGDVRRERLDGLRNQQTQSQQSVP